MQDCLRLTLRRSFQGTVHTSQNQRKNIFQVGIWPRISVVLQFLSGHPDGISKNSFPSPCNPAKLVGVLRQLYPQYFQNHSLKAPFGFVAGHVACVSGNRTLHVDRLR